MLVPTHGASPSAPPEARPIGRAALKLATSGIDVVFGDDIHEGALTGFRALPGRWVPVQAIPLDAAHDRFPSQLRAARFRALVDGLQGCPMGNALAFTMLCRDKLETQRVLTGLGIPMPPVTGDHERFTAQLEAWQAGFLKPQFGALGLGVRRVVPGDMLPTRIAGVVPGRPDPSILQAAIEPPDGWRSRTVRVLIQRTTEGGWWSGQPVVRQSREDPVANAARGAEVAPGEAVLDAPTLRRLRSATTKLCEAIDVLDPAREALEAGADFVLDAQYEPWLIELNSRPRGRLEVLAEHTPERYLDAHVEACARPIRVLAASARKTP